MSGRLLFLLTAIILLAGCAKKLAPQDHYQSTPVVADGIPNEWTLPLRFSNANYTLQYNVTNDNNNIYVCVVSRDETTMIRMLRAGVTLYFDPKGGNDKGISLHYPLRKQPDPASFHDRNGTPLTPQNDSVWKEELLSQSDSYGTTDFSGIDNGQFSVTDPKSPVRIGLKLNNHDSMLVYEAMIPIHMVLNADLSGRNPKKAFSVGVILNTLSGGSVANNQRRGGGRGLGLGMNGMHMGGGHRYGGNDNSQPPLKEDANWYQFRLVSH